MPDCLSSIKTAVREVEAYSLKHLDAAIKINQNENPFEMPKAIKAAVEEIMAKTLWSRYPPFVPDRLAATLARFSGWRADGILVGNGSNELIQAVLSVVVEKGKRVVIPQPTFTLYRLLSTILGGDCQEVYLTEDFDFDVPGMLPLVKEADITIICSPNNPTGCLMEQSDLKHLLSEAKGLVVVDEAYHEFSRQTAVPLLNEFQNLIVLRTFSKAMAMAGLRVGYLLAHPKLAREISKAKLPYNLNVFSMAAAETAVGHYGLLQPQVELIIRERERLFAEMQKLPGVHVLPSQANFLAFATPLAPSRVFDQFHAESILIRDVSRYPMLGQFLRVSVGTPSENDRFLGALKQILYSRDCK